MPKGGGLKPDTLVKVTIPARLVTKEQDNNGARDMRWMLDSAFKVALGRCTWNSPTIITATVEQFGVFCYLLTEKGHQSFLGQIEVEMFAPIYQPQPYVVDASEQGSKRLCIPRKNMPVFSTPEQS